MQTSIPGFAFTCKFVVIRSSAKILWFSAHVLLVLHFSQPDTFVTFEEMTEKLVQEITHHIEAYSLFPTKIRLVTYVGVLCLQT